MAGADHAEVDLVGHGEAEIAADVPDDLLEHELGVEQRAVHVEHHGGEGGQRLMAAM